MISAAIASTLTTAISTTVTNIFRAWWFDPFIASLSFFLSIMFYSYHELREGKSCYKNFSEFLWGKGVDKIDDRPSLNLSLFAYWVFVLMWVNIVPPPTTTTTSAMSLSYNNNDHTYNCSDTIIVDATHAFSSCQEKAKWEHSGIPDGIPNSFASLGYLFLEVLIGIFFYDTIFFAIHLAMHHESKFLPTTIKAMLNHKEHHKSTQYLEARHVLRHSLLDGMLQVMVNIAVQRYTPWGIVKSRLARMVHNIIVTMMLTESHCASSYPNFFKFWCVGVREHRNHHLGGGHHDDVVNNGVNRQYHHHHYQQFFGHWDALRDWYLTQKHDKCKLE